MRLLPQWSTCLSPTCATKHAMAWECPAKLPSPAKPDLTWRAHSAKPTAPHGGSWPSLRAGPEQLPLVSVPHPAQWACPFGDRVVRLERILRRLFRVSRGPQGKEGAPSHNWGPSRRSFTFGEPAFEVDWDVVHGQEGI